MHAATFSGINIMLRKLISKTENSMQLKTILNRVEKHNGFIYGKQTWTKTKSLPEIEIVVRPRKGSRPYCAGCGRLGTTYDTGKPRRFQYIPFWGILI